MKRPGYRERKKIAEGVIGHAIRYLDDFLAPEVNSTLTTQWKVAAHLQPAAGLKAGATATVEGIMEVSGLELCVTLRCH